MLILHGSATGTATDIAANLFRLARRYRIPDLRLSSLQDCSLVNLVESDVAIFVVSTTGNGDVPAAMHRFWLTLLRTDVDAHLLEDLDFMVLGLGDSKYVQFNWTAKKLRRRLLQLGGQEVMNMVMCDESATEGLDTALMPFLESFKDLLRELNGDIEPIPKSIILPPVSPVHLVGEQDTLSAPSTKVDIPIAGIKDNVRLTGATHFQDVRLMTFNVLANEKQTIEPGDVLSLWPSNSDSTVDRFLELLGWRELQDAFVRLPINSKALEFFHDPSSITLRQFIKTAIPIHGIPSLNLFTQLAQFTQDGNFKEKFEEWEQPDGKDDLYDYLTRPRRTLLEVIEDFASGIKIPVEYCIDLFGLIVSRSYSIAGVRQVEIQSSAKQLQTCFEVELLVAMVKYQTKIKEPRQGQASRYLSGLYPEQEDISKLVVTIDKPIIAANKMPTPPRTTPLLLICTGTGFAPLRFFISRLQCSEDIISKQHEMTLLFGCRSHEDDLVTLTLSESIRNTLKIAHAYSRLPNTPKQYVQDLIPLQAENIKSTVARGGKVYLCGSSGAMPDAVRAAIDTLIGSGTVEMLQEQGRWWQETW